MTFDTEYYALAVPLFLDGLQGTLFYCSISILVALPLSAMIALMRLSRHLLFRLPALWFIEVLRNIPFLVLVFIIFTTLPSLGVTANPVLLGLITLTAYGAAMFSESIRGAIVSVPKGQMHAARALGMPYLRSVWRIIFPQMLGYLIPSLTNQVIGLIKESALLSILGVFELSLAADSIAGRTFVSTKTYLILAGIYWVLTAVVAAVMMQLERRFAIQKTHAPARMQDLTAIPSER